ncbi:hypothetical protein DFH06DRAFT_1131235 [Mycena polygramma]|nr:hypothetical protein DFH06DRAFT_1131235 [Mycena polygramma]
MLESLSSRHPPPTTCGLLHAGPLLSGLYLPQWISTTHILVPETSVRPSTAPDFSLCTVAASAPLVHKSQLKAAYGGLSVCYRLCAHVPHFWTFSCLALGHGSAAIGDLAANPGSPGFVLVPAPAATPQPRMVAPAHNVLQCALLVARFLSTTSVRPRPTQLLFFLASRASRLCVSERCSIWSPAVALWDADGLTNTSVPFDGPKSDSVGALEGSGFPIRKCPIGKPVLRHSEILEPFFRPDIWLLKFLLDQKTAGTGGYRVTAAAEGRPTVLTHQSNLDY